MYLFIADLTKAFDTLKYWSKAFSWKCLDLPDDLRRILINLDSGSELGGATTQVKMGQGRLSAPFHHGRGVRQGSVGGPLKWVVFVHYWITWVKTRMAGKGYKMSASGHRPHHYTQLPSCQASLRTLSNFWPLSSLTTAYGRRHQPAPCRISSKSTISSAPSMGSNFTRKNRNWSR